MGNWWRASSELRRKAAIIIGLAWAFGALPIAVVLFNLGPEWGRAALWVAVAPFMLAGVFLAGLVLIAPFVTRSAMPRIIMLAVAAFVIAVLFEQPLAAGLYAGAVVLAWAAIEASGGRKAARS